MDIPTRIFWQDKGDIISQSMANELGYNLALLKPYAIVPDDMWEWMLSCIEKVSTRSLNGILYG